MPLHSPDTVLKGLFFIQRYRYLTIDQFAYITQSTYDKAGQILRTLERKKIVGHFGNKPIGAGKVRKVCYLTRKGHGFLMEHFEEHQDEIGGYKKVNTDIKWTAKMTHTLALIDCFLAMEMQTFTGQKYTVEAVYNDNKKEKIDGRIRTETTDLIDDEGRPESRIIPDGTLILRSLETGKKALFFVEYDNGTETIKTDIQGNYHKTIQYKFEQYERYLKSGRFALKYKKHDDFPAFRLLFVTDSKTRASNIARDTGLISEQYRKLFFISDIETALDDFFHSNWLLPCGDEATSRPIIKG